MELVVWTGSNALTGFQRAVIYFKHATYEELRHIAYTQRTSITAIVNAAVEAYLDAKGE